MEKDMAIQIFRGFVGWKLLREWLEDNTNQPEMLTAVKKDFSVVMDQAEEVAQKIAEDQVNSGKFSVEIDTDSMKN